MKIGDAIDRQNIDVVENTSITKNTKTRVFSIGLHYLEIMQYTYFHDIECQRLSIDMFVALRNVFCETSE